MISFIAPAPQLVAAAVLVVGAVAAAFLLFPPGARREAGTAPVVGTIALPGHGLRNRADLRLGGPERLPSRPYQHRARATTVDVLGQFLLIAVVLGLVAWGLLRNRRSRGRFWP